MVKLLHKAIKFVKHNIKPLVAIILAIAVIIATILFPILSMLQ